MKSFHRLGPWMSRGLVFGVVALVLAACSTTPASVTEVAIVEGDQALVVGDTAQLSVDVTAQGGADESVTWSTSDAGVVTVTAGGEIEAVAAGTAQVRAESVFDDTVFDEVTVTVTEPTADPAVTSVTIEQGDQTLQVGDAPVQLTVDVVAVNGASEDVSWSTSDAGVVTVTAGGQIEAVGGGTAQVRAESVFADSVFDEITVDVALPPLDAANVFVDASAEPGGNGSSAFPFQLIADGIAAANEGGTVNLATGTYTETLAITKPLTLLGAGTGLVTIATDTDCAAESDDPAIGGSTGGGGAICIGEATGVDLSGFTLQVAAPGPDLAAILIFRSSGDVSITDVDIEHTNADRDSNGIWAFSTPILDIQNVSVTETSGVATSAGVYLSGTTSDVTIDTLATSGHESGLGLRPTGSGMANVSLTNATIAEVNKSSLNTIGGPMTNYTAPQFDYIVRNTLTGDRSFMKETLEDAIFDSLFNFGSDWPTSHIREAGADLADLQNVFYVASRDGADAPYPAADEVRSHSIQTAIDAAASGATVNVEAAGGIFDGPLTLDVANLTLTGVGADSVITSATDGPVITVSAAGVSVTDVQIESTATVQEGVLVDGVDAFAINGSNLLTDPALESDGGTTIDATNNWWAADDGPSGDGPGTGNELIDPAGEVDVTDFTASPF
ncbi:MAG: Ig-like domain-containing protein [Thioalkalivibrio sp.]|nr:Ig-like domain-containing protein [Thioalkalivibrio sp.]